MQVWIENEGTPNQMVCFASHRDSKLTVKVTEGSARELWGKLGAVLENITVDRRTLPGIET